MLIGHRGSCGYRPEHTLASYELAARTGADYLEPDVVSTSEGVLVCRHENELSDTTDIAERAEFADRKRTKTIDGFEVTGWFTEDLTLAEVKSLRAIERLPELRPRNTALDGQHQVPTFAELLALRAELAAELGRPLGVYVETKHPTYFAEIGLPLEEPLLADLAAHDLGVPQAQDDALARVVVQSFELGNLQRLRSELGTAWPLVYLVAQISPGDDAARQIGGTLAELLAPAGLAELAEHVDGIGPERGLVIRRLDENERPTRGSWGAQTSLVPDAHHAGLVVHPWTLRAENYFLPGPLRSGEDPRDTGDVQAEMRSFLEAGVDGFFTDHVDHGRAAIDTFLGRSGS